MLVFAGGIATTKGWADESTTTTVIGAITAVAPALWSLWNRRPAGIIAEAAALPQVHQIIADPEIANSPTFAADPRVVGPDHR